MKFQVDPWSPEMGTSFEAAAGPEDDASHDIDLEVELDEKAWRGIRPQRDPATSVLFVDGVRRLDARIWIETEAGQTVPGFCASYAAGAVCCASRAQITESEVARGIFSPTPMAPVETSHARWIPKRTDGALPTDLSNGIQAALRQLEIEVTERTAETGLTIVDGSLRGRQHVRGVVGYIKSHWVRYLPPSLEPIIEGLAAAERTPVFLIRSDWSRFSWYLRLTTPTSSPWSGIVRCEVADHLSAERAIELAELTVATLPRFSSSPHKDPRAPQNLVPIGGQEAHLRRTLGDPLLLHRGLSVAAAAPGVGA